VALAGKLDGDAAEAGVDDAVEGFEVPKERSGGVLGL
jgi:hypothetical protein